MRLFETRTPLPVTLDMIALIALSFAKVATNNLPTWYISHPVAIAFFTPALLSAHP